jgi:energy-coupling factor transport system ATP-binding protein
MGIRFNEVSYQYGSFSNISASAIYKINLEIQDTSEFIALVGHTGSGKTTLAKHMNALIFPTDGSLDIFGRHITQKRNKKINYNDIRQDVGLVFQFPEYQLFEETVLKDVMFGPLNFHMNKDKAKELAMDAIKLVGLDESYYDRNPFNLSGGEKKRVSIAGILAMDPKILVLDEPTSGLDPRGKRVLMELFLNIHQKTNKSIIIITHDMDLVYEYFNRVIVMNEGEKIFDGQTDALFKDEALIEKYLDYPNAIKVMKHINETMNLNCDIYQKTPEQVIAEIKRVVAK